MYPTRSNLIGPKVVLFRHKNGWTQDTLIGQMQSKGIALTRSVLANIETGRSPANSRQVYFLAAALGVQPGDLFPPIEKFDGKYVGLSEPIPTRKKCKNRKPRSPNRKRPLARRRSP
jgi:transcriptional regulator with XRE-family HTH domain